MSEQECTRPELGDLLGAYELGLLEGPDQLRFEKHLEHCPACAEELYDGAAASEAMRREPGRYAEALNTANRGAPWPERILESIRRLVNPRVLVPVGAVGAIALLLAVLQPPGLPSSADLALIEPLPYQGLQLRGGPGQDLDRMLAAGMEQYAAGHYRDAARSLGLAWQTGRTDAEWLDNHQTALFLGLSLLLDQRPDEALEPLMVAAESELLPIAERAAWYLAQTQLLRENPAGSLPFLESLLNSPVYKVRAAAQLQSVREFCDNSSEG